MKTSKNNKMENERIESGTNGPEDALVNSGPSRRKFINLAAATAGTVAIAGIGLSAFAAPRKTKMDTPLISCAGSTQVSINIQVCAGATGAPAGFSVQWMTLAEYTANGNQWYLSEDLRLCKASFSGNANLSRYTLAANECVTVNIGEFLFDNGASTNCEHALECGTAYVFRAFAHATSTLARSDFTVNQTCATSACTQVSGCTLTQGYWKTHGPTPVGGNAYTWPVSVQGGGLMLGTVLYMPSQLLDIFNTPAAGNGLIALAHQLIAAKLNVANGADATAVAQAISDADALIGALVVPPIGAGFLAPSVTGALITALTNYNEGGTGPGHCS
jgi:hypothetical protein